MKAIKLFFAITLIMSSCVVSSCSNENSGNIDGYTFLSTLNVEDAKTIFKQGGSSTVRSRSNDTSGTYWKIDVNGDMSELVFTGEDNKSNNVRIDKIVKFGNRFLYLIPNSQDLYDLGAKNELYDCFVDKNTGKIYKSPMSVYLGEEYFYAKDDQVGNVFFRNRSSDSDGVIGAIYKLDVTNFTIKKEVSLDDETFDYWTDFTPFGDGSLIVGNFIRLSNGNLIRLNEDNRYNDYFVLKSKLYKTTGTEMYKCELQGGSLSEIKIGDCAINTGYTKYNTAKETIVFRGAGNDDYAVEFDGDQTSSLSIPWYDIEQANNYTSSFWWTGNTVSLNDRITNIDIISMIDYSQKSISVQGNDYEATKFISNDDSDKITFTGFKLNGGVKIIGSIDISGKIDIVELDANSEQVIDLIPLN